MPKQNKFQDVRKFEKIVIGGIVVASVCFVLLQFRNSTPKFSPTLVSDLNLQSPEENYSDFSTWQKQANFDEMFNFYLPSILEVKTIEEGKSFRIISIKKPESPLISVEHLEYADFQKEKLSLDKQGEKQYGWTNAYGASIFEYKKEVLTSFVVDKEKKKVLKLLVTDEKNFTLQENITRTFQSSTKETDIHGPWYVNFKGGYKIRYGSDISLQTENPFENEVSWKVKFKDPKKTGDVTMRTDGLEADLGFDPLKKIKVDGVEAYLKQNDELSSSFVWQKDKTLFLFTAVGDSQQTNQTLNSVMQNMLVSFRFLTEQERMQE